MLNTTLETLSAEISSSCILLVMFMCSSVVSTNAKGEMNCTLYGCLSPISVSVSFSLSVSLCLYASVSIVCVRPCERACELVCCVVGNKHVL